jgi:hypothetical protein
LAGDGVEMGDFVINLAPHQYALMDKFGDKDARANPDFVTP